MSLGKKIAQFEQKAEQTVKTFNQTFPHSPLQLRASLEVEIGEIVGPANVRRLLVGGKEVIHAFHTDVATSAIFGDIMGEEYEQAFELDEPEKEENGTNSQLPNLVTNAQLPNYVLTDKEAKTLDPLEYFVLQYFRGSQSPYHTKREIAEKLNHSDKTIRYAVQRLEDKGVIKTKFYVNMRKLHVTINEGWY